MMAVVLVSLNVQRLNSVHALQSDGSLEEKHTFYELNSEWDMHSVDCLVMCLGDSNGHVNKYVDGFDGVHGRYDVGHKNLEATLLLHQSLSANCALPTMHKGEA